MDFWLLDVKSTVIVNGKDIAFDYINTYFDRNEALNEAKLLAMNEDVLDISVHHWILKEDGTQDHTTEIIFTYFNENHRELVN